MQNQELVAQDDGVQGYMLLFRGKDWDEGLSRDELQVIMDRTLAWYDRLIKSGKVKGGHALAREGYVIKGKRGAMATDGPFVESKEAVGGALVLDVASYEEAIAIAKSSPGLDYGIIVEVRPVLNECPVFKRVRKTLGMVPAEVAL